MSNKNTTKIKSFVLYADYEKHITKLNNEQRGRLLTAMFLYFNEGIIPMELDPATEMLMSVIAAQMDRDREKYEEISEKNRLNGIKGAEAKKAKAAAAQAEEADVTDENVTEASEATAYFGEQQKANACSDMQTDDYSEIDKELDAIFEQKRQNEDAASSDSVSANQAVADFAKKQKANQAYNNNINNNINKKNNDNNNTTDNNNNIDMEARLKQIYARLNGGE